MQPRLCFVQGKTGSDPKCMNVLLPRHTTTIMYYYNALVPPPLAPHVIVRTIFFLNLLKAYMPSAFDLGPLAPFQTSFNVDKHCFGGSTSPPRIPQS